MDVIAAHCHMSEYVIIGCVFLDVLCGDALSVFLRDDGDRVFSNKNVTTHLSPLGQYSTYLFHK